MDRYALVIGIAQYQSSNLKPLPKAATDAEVVARVLEQYGKYTVTRLPHRGNAESQRFEVAQQKSVSADEVCEALQTLLLERGTKSDVLIYFAGHGLTFFDNLGEQKGVLATSDSQVEMVDKKVVDCKRGIDLSSLNQLIKKSDFSSLVMLLDCCHSGYFLESQLVQQTLTAFSTQRDYYLIAACRSFETVKALNWEANAIFTGALLKGLASENASRNGEVSGDRLFDYISNELKGSQWGQEPIRMGWGRSINLVKYRPSETPANEITFDRKNPYLGLYAFKAEQEKYFCGREEAIRTLITHLTNSRFLSILGYSGSGKSSLIKAGLLPQLSRDRIPGSSQWSVKSFTPGDHPLGKLVDILARHREQNQPFVIFIDQFEEVFTLCEDEAERKDFIRLIAEEMNDTERKSRMIIALRGDFLSRCTNYPDVLNLINHIPTTTYIVKSLGIEELPEAIEKPAELHGVKFEQGLVWHIAKDVDGQPGALPLLQYALKELWRVCIEKPESPEPLLTKKGYEEIGGVQGALENRANVIYKSLRDGDRVFVRKLFMELVQLGEGKEVTRRRVDWDRLRAIADSPEQLERVIGRLAGSQQRLIIVDENSVEVAHEALLSQWNLLSEWIEDDLQNIRISRLLERACRDWKETYGESDEELLTGLRLAEVEEWEKRVQPKLTEDEGDFLGRSVDRRDREEQAELEQQRQLRELAEAKVKAEEARAIAAEDKVSAEAARTREAEARVRVQKQRTRLAIASLIAVTGLTILTGTAWINAERGQIIALSQASEAKFILNRNSLDPLVEALKAGTRLKQIDWVPGNKEVRQQVMETLTQAVYWVRERDRLQAHNNLVQSVSFSPDGKILASAGYDNTVKLWNLEGKQKKLISLPHDRTVFSVTFSPDSKTIASASFDKTVKLWNRDGTPKGSPLLHSNRVYAVAFNPKGDKIATGDHNGTVTIWDLKENKKNEFKNAHNRVIVSLSFSPDGSLLATASQDRTVKIWNIDANGIIKNRQRLPHSDIVGVDSVSFSRNGEIATASMKGKVKLWKADGSLLRELTGNSRFTSVTFSHDGKIIAAGRLDGKVQLLDTSGKEIGTLEGHTERVNSVSFSPNGKTIASASNDQTVKLWQIQLPLLTHLKAHDSRVMDVSFSPDGKIFASASLDATIKLWDISGNFQQSLKGHRLLVDSVSFSPNSEKIASTSRDDTVKIWTRQGKEYKQEKPNQIFTRRSSIGDSSVSFSTDLKNPTIAVADTQGIVWFMDTNRKLKRPPFPAHEYPILKVSLSPDGKSVATASEDGTAKIWHLDGKLKHTLPGHTSGVQDVSFSRDGNRIATASKDNTVKLWDRNGNLLKTLTGHSAAVISVSFSPDGDVIATASDDRTIKLWNLDGTLITTLKGHSGGINSISFNPKNSKILISGSSDSTIIIWHLENLTLDGLLKRGCEHLHGYVQNDSQGLNNICK